jgi:hypothetical protein|tara:strand:+ start:286 stop:630 length:345 start_codon:yes stop_codon:yes gene_type:complete
MSENVKSMAVINCPSCTKKISDKAKFCSHCQLDLANVDQDKIQYLSKVSFVQKHQRLMNYSFIAMLLFCGGFLTFWQYASSGTWQYNASIASTAGGFVLYIVIRIRLLFLKRSQ